MAEAETNTFPTAYTTDRLNIVLHVQRAVVMCVINTIGDLV